MSEEQEQRIALGRRIYARRRTLGLSQEQLAALAHVSARTIRSYEAERTLPLREHYWILEFALNWESGSIDNILAGGEADTFDKMNGGYLRNQLPDELRQAPAGREEVWHRAWKTKEDYQEAYDAAALEKENREHPKKAGLRYT